MIISIITGYDDCREKNLIYVFLNISWLFHDWHSAWDISINIINCGVVERENGQFMIQCSHAPHNLKFYDGDSRCCQDLNKMKCFEMCKCTCWGVCQNIKYIYEAVIQSLWQCEACVCAIFFGELVWIICTCHSLSNLSIKWPP